MKSYHINLIRNLRDQELAAERRQRLQITAGLASIAFLCLVVAYSALAIWKMERVLAHEKQKVAGLRKEYKKYTATQMIVDKADVELLNKLQGRGIFWTNKLAAMAKHLPENYWITGFSFDNNELKVSGFGFISPKQDQLLVLDGYLNRLRSDATFSDVFKRLYLNNAERKDEQGGTRISFQFSCVIPGRRK